MKKITKAELIEFIKKNCYHSMDNRVDWMWREGCGSQSSKEINAKVAVLFMEDALQKDGE